MRKALFLFGAVAMAMAVACSDEPEKSGTEGSDIPSNDPMGTQTVKLSRGGDGLDGLMLDADGKFVCKEGMIVNTGSAKSLADIKSIPTSGWREELAAEQGKGYVYAYNGDYYRLRVSKKEKKSVEVKYQKPFAGANETPEFATTILEFPAEGGSQVIAMSNSSVIPFTVKSTSECEWCRVMPFGDLDIPFLANGILVEVCPVRYKDIEGPATFTLSTLNGRSVEIVVKRPTWNESNVMPETLYFSKKGYDALVTLPEEGLKLKCDAEWLDFIQEGTDLLVMPSSTTVDRQAVISFEGRSETITVIQSKYDEGDVYDEGGVKGTVVKMEGAVRVVRSAKLGEATYSTENKFAGALASSDGRLNMAKIKQMPDWQRRYPAFALCDALNTGGVSGWYLPALDEVWNLSGDMWLSTEASNKYAFSCEKESFGSVAGRESKQKVYAVYAHYRF